MMSVRLEHLHARDQRRVGQEAAVAAHRVVDRQPVAVPDGVVLLAVPGRGVHGARAGIERHVLAEDDRHLPIVERMLQLQTLERSALDLGERRPGAHAERQHRRLDTLVRNQQALASVA